GDSKGKVGGTAAIDRIGNKTTYTGTMLLDIADKPPAASDKTGSKEGSKSAAKDGSKGGSAEVSIDDSFSEQLKPLLLGTVRMRFVLHAPAPITDTNADIVLNRRMAICNCSLIAFMKDKTPIKMTATY